MKRLTTLILITIALGLVFVGCTKEPSPQEVEEKPDENLQQKDDQSEKSLKDYFPLTKGSTWNYMGEGNEYASFNRQVMFVEGNKAQVEEDNGGTVAAAVFTTSDAEVTRVFFQGEEYENTNFIDEDPNDHLVILKAPIKVGTKWQDAEGGSREIIAIDAQVETPAEVFEDCIKVKITRENSITYEYYKEGVGMVKREFESEGMKVISRLEEYKISE